MKGFMKSLKYFTKMFGDDDDNKMEIGLPTDVRHVAHIGVDSNSVSSTPSWMEGFKDDAGVQTATISAIGEDARGIASGVKSNVHMDINKNKKPRQKSALESESPSASPRSRSGAPKSRRQRKDAAPRDHSRRQRPSNQGNESPAQDLPGGAKRSRRKKSRGDSMDGSEKSYTFAEPEPVVAPNPGSKRKESRTMIVNS